MKKNRPLAKINALSYAALIRELIEVPSSYHDLAEATGLAYTTIREAIYAWHIQKIVFVAGYKEDVLGRRSIKLWSFGLDRKDCKPLRYTPAERQKRHRQKKKALYLATIFAQGVSNVSQAH